MDTFLADENVPQEAIQSIRQLGLDVAWVKEVSPGVDDDRVLEIARADNRVLITFDKDFGEMALRRGKAMVPGILLLHPRLRGQDYLARFVSAVLSQPTTWRGHFTVAREGRIRVIPLPD